MAEPELELGVRLHDQTVWLTVPGEAGVVVRLQLYRPASGELVVNVVASHATQRIWATANLPMRPIPYMQRASSSMPRVTDEVDLSGAAAVNPYLR